MQRSRRWKATALTATVLTATLGLTASISGATPPPSALAGWPRQLGTADYDSATAVAVSTGGDVYIAGGTNGTLEPGSSHGIGWDVFVAKYDKYGTFKWLHQFGTVETDAVTGIAVSSSGDAYVTGYTSGKLDPTTPDGTGQDAYLVKYDKNGNLKWLRQLGTAAQDGSNGVALSPMGDAYVTGFTQGKLDPARPDGTGQDAFIVKYNKSGTRKWLRQFGTTAKDQAAKVAVSGTGIYVTGYTEGLLATGAVADANGDGFLARYDASGAQKWVRQISSPNGGPDHYDEGWDVSAVGSDVYVSGWTNGDLGPAVVPAHGYDQFVARFSNTGTARQIAQVGTTGNESATNPALVASGGSVFLGSSTDGTFPGFTNQGGFDGFIARFTRDLTPGWTRQYGTSSNEFLSGLAVRGSNNYGGALVVAGETAGTVWGQISYGGVDAFIATFPR